MVVGGGSQRLLSLNPTTDLAVLLLGLWLLMGCDNIPSPFVWNRVIFHNRLGSLAIDVGEKNHVFN